jgi:ABC-type cobalt transport system substrate-binding protein
MSNFEIEVKNNRRRQTRVLALYLTLKAWIHDLDCVVVSREDLIKFFGFDNTTKDRIEQIKKDMKPYFKEHKVYYREGSTTYVHYLFFLKNAGDISRLPSGSHLPLNKKIVNQLIAGMDTGGPKTALLTTLVAEVPSESQIISGLARLASGLEARIFKP